MKFSAIPGFPSGCSSLVRASHAVDILCVVAGAWAALGTFAAEAKDVAYIHGHISAAGVVDGNPPFHQMLLSDTGDRGCSEFKEVVENEGYTITSHRDTSVTLDPTFLAPFDVIVFGLHQKVWTAPEKAALDAWIHDGGGILMYSDSAAGGDWQQVGIQNQTGQTAVNSILTAYGMQVSVDHAAGTRSYTSPSDAVHPIVSDQPELEGEGVSPVAIDETAGVVALIPCEDAFKTGGGGFTPNLTQGITIPFTRWAALAHRPVGAGHVMAMFDRQPVWNLGEGSHIDRKDNREILRRIVRFLASDYKYPIYWLNLNFGSDLDLADQATVWGWNADAEGDGIETLAELVFHGDPFVADGPAIAPQGAMAVRPADGKSYLELSWRQWAGGMGTVGVDYTARGVTYRAEHSENLQPDSWMSGAGLVEQVGAAIPNGDGTETVTVRMLPAVAGSGRGFARLRLMLDGASDPLSVDAGDDRLVSLTGSAYLNGDVTGPTIAAVGWSKVSGPGAVTFANASSPETTATFGATGIYQLALTASNGSGNFADAMTVEVVDPADVVAAIHCGNTGSGHIGNNGFNYVADTHYSGGHTDNFPGNAVANTDDDPLYHHARSNHGAYDIPVTNGDYLVLLQFSETYWTGTNQRVFDTFIEGILVIDDLDLVADAPGKWVAYDRAFETTVNDGFLTITHSASVNNSLLNGLVVIQR